MASNFNTTGYLTFQYLLDTVQKFLSLHWISNIEFSSSVENKTVMNFGAGVSNSKNPSPLRPIELPIIPAGNKSSF